MTINFNVMCAIAHYVRFSFVGMQHIRLLCGIIGLRHGCAADETPSAGYGRNL